MRAHCWFIILTALAVADKTPSAAADASAPLSTSQKSSGVLKADSASTDRKDSDLGVSTAAAVATAKTPTSMSKTTSTHDFDLLADAEFGDSAKLFDSIAAALSKHPDFSDEHHDDVSVEIHTTESAANLLRRTFHVMAPAPPGAKPEVLSADEETYPIIELDEIETEREIQLEVDPSSDPIDWFTSIWTDNSLPAHMRKNLTNWSHIPTYIKEPPCYNLGYVTFVARTANAEMRTAIRNQLKNQQGPHISIGNDKHHPDPVFSWLKENFVVQNVPTTESQSHSPLIQVVFPVGWPTIDVTCANTVECSQQQKALTDEASRFNDLLIMDLPDTMEFQGLKSAGTMLFLDECRSTSKWQWLVKFEPVMVLNVPNIVYMAKRQDLEYVRKQDASILEETVEEALDDGLPGRVTAPGGVQWWIGYEMEGMPVVTSPESSPIAETSGIVSEGENYPPYLSKRFFMLHRRLVEDIVPRYRELKTIFRNDDAMIGILIDRMNEDYGTTVRPYDCQGVAPYHNGEVFTRLCGRLANYLLDCDCRKWLAYPPKDPQDRYRVSRNLEDRCPFTDYYFYDAVDWLKSGVESK